MSSRDNWFRILLRALDEDVLEVGVNDFVAARHPKSPVRRGLYFSKSKVTRNTLKYAFERTYHWDQLWEIGALQIKATDAAKATCTAPNEDWVSFIKQHCAHLLRDG